MSDSDGPDLVDQHPKVPADVTSEAVTHAGQADGSSAEGAAVEELRAVAEELREERERLEWTANQVAHLVEQRPGPSVDPDPTPPAPIDLQEVTVKLHVKTLSRKLGARNRTQAAMIGFMNQNMRRHVDTLENPIEFLHRDVNCSITQREVGIDTDDFRVGLRAALRQDPDVILIGEMRDTESIDIALKSAETGHLVISTVHTRDAAATISRLVATFPPDEQKVVRLRLAEQLQAVISQRLLPSKDGKGRVLAAEVMVVSGTIRDCIADPDRTAEIPEHIAAGKTTYGMQTFDQALMDLVISGQVDYAVAKAAATNPGDFELKMNMLSASGTTSGPPTSSPSMAGLSQDYF